MSCAQARAFCFMFLYLVTGFPLFARKKITKLLVCYILFTHSRFCSFFKPLQDRCKTVVSPFIKRRRNGGETEVKRRRNGGKAEG